MYNKSDFYKAFGEYAGVPSDVLITSIDTETGYCETCYYEYTATIVRGTHEDGRKYEHESSYSLSEFVNSLT